MPFRAADTDERAMMMMNVQMKPQSTTHLPSCGHSKGKCRDAHAHGNLLLKYTSV
jgi:hypothetical protein